MPQEGKPEAAPVAPTTPQGSEVQSNETQQAANPSVEMSDSVRSYLKGLGLEGVQATPELVKVAEAGMKQKESVSKMSLEKEQLLARLSSQGKDTSEPVVEHETVTTPAPMPQETEAKTTGVSDNDLFDLARMISTDFKDLSDSAQDGSLFRELRQLGYFKASGIDKKAVYDYLSLKNSQAQELRELREFKQKYGQPNPENNPVYNPTPGYNMQGEMNANLAHSIVMSGDKNAPRYNEALKFMREQAYNSK